jgi:hypothetical protein
MPELSSSYDVSIAREEDKELGLSKKKNNI